MFIKTKILFLFFLILSLVSNVKEIYGITYFSDNFDQENLNNWDFVNINADQESWKIVDKKLVGEIVSGKYSLLLSKSFSNLSDYSIQIDAMNEGGIDQDIVFRVSEDRSKYYLLNIRFKDPFWPQDNKGEIILWKCSSLSCGRNKRLIDFNDLTQINLTQNQIHKIKIEANGSNIKAYFDSVLVIDFNDIENPFLTGNFGFYNWGGSYYERPTKNLFDNLIIGDFNYDEPVIKNSKIIIVPGFGASWNSEAIVYNSDIDNDQWKMTPFVKNYNGLINALKENGLKEDEDYYIWNYDWRKPLKDIVTDLDSFIDQNINSNEKVILVGHSFGGLVSRIWAEDNDNDSRLEKVIALGSPHLGSVEAYEAWNGGRISDLSKFSSIAFKILLKLQGLTTKTDMEAVRKYTPSVQDLLPTFEFATKNGVDFNSQLKTKNDYLINKNNEAVNSEVNLKLFAGNGFKTMNTINLKNNNIFDKVLGIWPDGRINNFSFTNSGDGTVLVKSANYSKSDFVEIESSHGDIVDKTVNQVMTEIGLSQVDIISELENLKNTLVVFVGSPVNYSVSCDEEAPVLENDGFVVIKNKNYKICTLNLIGTGNGLVHVVSGNTDDDNWSYWEKSVENEEVNNINIDPKTGRIINDKNNILFLKSIIRNDINSLILLNKENKDLKEALKFLEKDKPGFVIKKIFDFREKNEEREISQKIIDNANLWLSLINKCSKNEATKGLKIINNYRDLIEILVSNKKNFKIDINMATDYQEINDLLEINEKKLKKNDYQGICSNNFVILNYGNGILKKSYGNGAKKWSLQDSDL